MVMQPVHSPNWEKGTNSSLFLSPPPTNNDDDSFCQFWY